MTVFFQDLRFALRQLRRSPGFSAAAIFTLALGIGGVAAVFSVVHGVLLRPLPYDGADRIVTLWESLQDGRRSAISEPNFADWREYSRSFEVIALHGNPDFGGPATILGAETAVRARATPVWDGFFSVFRISPAIGRRFATDERQQGAPGVVKISDSFWRTHLAADPNVLGRTLEFWGEMYEVVGVLPEGFHYPADTDLWFPAERFGSNSYRTAHNWSAVGRLRDGVSVDAANAEMRMIGAMLRAQHGEEADARGAVATQLQDAMVGDLRTPLLILLGASLLVLLIACSNLAGTLLGRGFARKREIAVRTALGAGRTRIVRQMLTESLVLSVLGALAGLALALLLGRALVSLGPESIDPGAVALDGRVLAFVFAATLATTFLVGLLPALRTSRTEPGQSIRSGARGSTGARTRFWGALIVAEVAVALALLIGSALLIRSFSEVLRIDPGFDAERVLTIDIAPPESRYAGDDEKAAYYEALLDELRTLPGVKAAGLVQHLPFGGMDWNGSFEIEGRGSSEQIGLYAHYRIASAGYFESMEIPVLQGRVFATADRAGTEPVVIINDALATWVWPGENPIGKRIRDLANEPPEYRDEWLTVAGVVGNVRHGGLLSAAPPELYVNVLQRPARAGSAVVTLATTVPPASVAPPARERIRALDPYVPAEFATMSTRIRRSVADRRFTMLVLGIFAAVALALAMVGIYGIITYTVAQRTREIGVRMALGAEAGVVVRSMVRAALLLAGVGLGVGLMLAVAGSRLLASLLYGVGALDPLTFGGSALLLLGVTLLAAYLPARRAARVDPMVALRTE
jgi:putative ABC transport system permease protein